jgi:hypothetical protein
MGGRSDDAVARSPARRVQAEREKADALTMATDPGGAFSGAAELTKVIRPAAVVPESSAAAIMAELTSRDVARGGVWNVSTTLWQRYSGPWDGVCGTTGSAVLIGSIAVAYETPVRNHITIYRVTVTEAGRDQGWTVEGLCDEALGYGGLTLDVCPRAELMSPPSRDPFKARRGL